eukprot:Nk52_evm8s2273 gene=Nk52_evmTU8s2273
MKVKEGDGDHVHHVNLSDFIQDILIRHDYHSHLVTLSIERVGDSVYSHCYRISHRKIKKTCLLRLYVDHKHFNDAHLDPSTSNSGFNTGEIGMLSPYVLARNEYDILGRLGEVFVNGIAVAPEVFGFVCGRNNADMDSSGVCGIFLEDIEESSNMRRLCDIMQDDSAKLAAYRRMEVAGFGALGTSVLEAVTAIHAKGIVHLNLKPSCIFIEARREEGGFQERTYGVRIGEFGCAGRHGEVFCSGGLRGDEESILYHSPETFSRLGGFINYSMDVYSLGLIFFRMLTGGLPFSSELSGEEVVLAHLRKVFPDINGAEYVTGVPRNDAGVADSVLSSDSGVINYKGAKTSQKMAAIVSGDLVIKEEDGDEAEDRDVVLDENFESAGPPAHMEKKLYPLWLCEIVNRMLKKKPSKRYQSCYRVTEDLNISLGNRVCPLSSCSADSNDGRVGQTLSEEGEGLLGLGGITRVEYVNSLRFSSHVLFGIDDKVNTLMKTTQMKNNVVLVKIRGLSGTGKSFLFQKFQNQLARSRFIVCESKCDAFNRHLPFLSWSMCLTHLIDEVCKLPENILSPFQKAVLSNRRIDCHVLREFAPNIEALVTFTKSDVVNENLSAKKRKQLESFTEFIQCLSNYLVPVLFFDDVQWIDSDSLEVMESMLAIPKHILVVVSYRKDEVSADHPFHVLCESNKLSDIDSVCVDCVPVTESDIEGFVKAKTGIRDRLELSRISRFVFKSTSGVLYDVVNTFIMMEREGYIVYDASVSKWVLGEPLKAEKDPVSVSGFEYGSSVMRCYSLHMQEFIKYASLFGSEFDKDFVLSPTKNNMSSSGVINEEFENDLSSAILERILAVVDSQNEESSNELLNVRNVKKLRFYHDRIQEMVVNSMSEDEIRCKSLAIATNIDQMYKFSDCTSALAGKSKGASDFTMLLRLSAFFNNVVDDIVKTGDERVIKNVIYCNWLAAEDSLGKLVSAETSLYYSSAAVALLQEYLKTPIEQSEFRDIAFKVYRVNLQALGLLKNPEEEEFQSCLRTLLSIANTRCEKGYAYRIYMQCLYHFDKMERIIEVACKIFALFTNLVDFMAAPSFEDVGNLTLQIDTLMEGKGLKPEDLINFPSVEDPELHLLGGVTMDLVPAAYMTGNFPLYTFLPAMLFFLHLKHGRVSGGCGACMCLHGFARAGFQGMYASGVALSGAGRKIVQRFSDDYFQCSFGLNCDGLTSLYGTDNLEVVATRHHRAYEYGVDAGDLSTQLYAGAFWCWISIARGCDLSRLRSSLGMKVTVWRPLVEQMMFFKNMEAIYYMLNISRRFGDKGDNGEFFVYRKIPSYISCLADGDPLTRGAMFIIEMELLVHHGEYCVADNLAANEIDEKVAGAAGMSPFFVYMFTRPFAKILANEEERVVSSEKRISPSFAEYLQTFIDSFKPVCELNPFFKIRYEGLIAEQEYQKSSTMNSLSMFNACVKEAEKHKFYLLAGFLCRRISTIASMCNIDMLSEHALERSSAFYSTAGFCEDDAYGKNGNEEDSAVFSGGKNASCDSVPAPVAGKMLNLMRPVKEISSSHIGSAVGIGKRKSDFMEVLDAGFISNIMMAISHSVSVKDLKTASIEYIMKYTGAQKAALFLVQKDSRKTGCGGKDTNPWYNVHSANGVPFVLHGLSTDGVCIVDEDELVSSRFSSSYPAGVVSYVARTKQTYHYVEGMRRHVESTKESRKLGRGVSLESRDEYQTVSSIDGGFRVRESLSSSANQEAECVDNCSVPCLTSKNSSTSLVQDTLREKYFQDNSVEEFVCIPLLCRNELSGIFYVERSTDGFKFESSSLTFLENLAIQVAVSIQNAYLYEELEMKVEERAQALKEKEKTASEMAFLLTTLMEHTKYGLVAARQNGEVILLNSELANIFDLPLVMDAYAQQNVKDILKRLITEQRNEALVSDAIMIDSASGKISVNPGRAGVNGIVDEADYLSMDFHLFLNVVFQIVDSNEKYIEPFDILVDGKTYFSVVYLNLKSGIKIVSIEDRTEKFKENELRQKMAIQARDDFLAFMCHELRNPLNGTMGLAEILSESSLSDFQREYVTHIGESCSHMATIVNDVLDFSKLEAAKLLIEEEEVEVRELINQCIELQKAGLSKAGVELVGRVSEDVPAVVMMDRTRIRQLVINLLSNAIKFTLAGRVSVSVSLKVEKCVKQNQDSVTEEQMDKMDTSPKYLSFEVEDTGIGLSPESSSRLFSKYFQVRNDYTKRQSGTGLGLRICKGLVERMNGSIGVFSSLGKGSKFWFEIPLTLPSTTDAIQKAVTVEEKQPIVVESLNMEMKMSAGPSGSAVVTSKKAPCADEFSAKVSTASPGRSNVDSLEGTRALVVDDDKLCRLVASRYLTKVQVKVDVAVNGQEAVDMIKKGMMESGNSGQSDCGPYDIVFMDLTMPLMDGYTAISNIRSADINYLGPIVALSANAIASEKQKAFEAGSNYFLSKPCTSEQVIGVLQKALCPQ